MVEPINQVNRARRERLENHGHDGPCNFSHDNIMNLSAAEEEKFEYRRRNRNRDQVEERKGEQR